MANNRTENTTAKDLPEMARKHDSHQATKKTEREIPHRQKYSVRYLFSIIGYQCFQFTEHMINMSGT